MTQKKVLISYSHDDHAHEVRVRAFADSLRARELTVCLDQYLMPHGPEEGWPRWMQRSFDSADHVVCVCTAIYCSRFEGREDPNVGLGVDWEGNLVYNALYKDKSASRKIVPVLFDDEPHSSIPTAISHLHHHRLMSDFEDLYVRITTPAPSLYRSAVHADSGPLGASVPSTQCVVPTSVSDLGAIRLQAQVARLPVSISNLEMEQALASSVRFGRVFDLDLRDTAFPGRDSQAWEALVKRMVTQYKMLAASSTMLRNDLAVFPFAPQTLVLVLGHLIGDRTGIRTFQRFHHGTSGGATWGWEPCGNGDAYWKLCSRTLREAPGNRVVVTLALSARVGLEEIDQALRTWQKSDGDNLHVVELGLESPGYDRLRTVEQLREFQMRWRDLLSRLRDERGPDLHVELFPAVPIPAAFAAGAVVHPFAERRLRVWELTEKGRVPSFSLDQLSPE